MGNSRPVKTACWRKFLQYRGCTEVGTNKHEKWKCPDCLQSIIFRHAEKDIPFGHIRTNLHTMGISTQDFWVWVGENC
jgi:hypothetical protein